MFSLWSYEDEEKAKKERILVNFYLAMIYLHDTNYLKHFR